LLEKKAALLMSPASYAPPRSRVCNLEGISVKGCFLGALVLAGAFLLAAVNESSVAENSLANDAAAPMRFELRTEGPAEQCSRQCRTWFSATGSITDGTVHEFELFAKKFDLRGATLVVNSEGGSVLAALAIGRIIRSLGMTTSVGTASLLPSVLGDAERATLSPYADCESMCPFMLLGGIRRHVPAEARVMVHQIWLGGKRKGALAASYSAEELTLVQRDVGTLASYTIEMGGDIKLIETALRIPPWEPLYKLSAEELRDMRITNANQLFEADTPIAVGSVASSKGTSAQASRN
jgi:hypothetical protein